jgi:hypothetical protein
MSRTIPLLAGLALAGFSAAASAQMTSLRSDLYSHGAVARFCSDAQQVVSNTTLWAWNINHNELGSFTESSAAPYEGINQSAYNGNGRDTDSDGFTEGTTLPLTTQQLVSHRVLPGTTWEYPIVISCKMKDAEAINFHFGSGSAGAQQSCKQFTQWLVPQVYASLTAAEQRMLKYTQDMIIYQNDFMVDAGPTWLEPLPLLPTVASLGRGTATGKLIFRSKAINVARTNPTTLADPDKKGSYYCHFASPEYIRALITGQTEPLIEG